MTRIGIITHYYGSTNYGGNLQAYALCKALNNGGCIAEQISFNPNVVSAKQKKGFKGFLRTVKRSLLSALNKSKNNKSVEKRAEAFYNFNQNMIPHSTRVYTIDTIGECVNDYDVFITGSDQVWNMKWYVPAFFLDFVPSEKRKASYSASFGAIEFSDEQRAIIKEHLKDFDFVSLREHSPLEGENVFPTSAVVTLDPTLLLDKEEWETICAPRSINDKYVLCYFFGGGEKERKIAREYADENGFKLVAIPHLNGYNELDNGYWDLELENASPEEFLSLINNAEFVFTDSFHAVVFSFIFEKQYVVFKRAKNDEMCSRIYSITELFSDENRFCDTEARQTLEYVRSLPKKRAQKSDRFVQMKKESVQFLRSIHEAY